jgi:hypothetical protein
MHGLPLDTQQLSNLGRWKIYVFEDFLIAFSHLKITCHQMVDIPIAAL